MGYKRTPTIFTLTNVDGNEGLIIRMKSLKIGKLRRLIAIIESDNEDLTKFLDEVFELLTDGLVSWNLEEEDGEPVPADREGVESLEMQLILGLLGDWIDKMTGAGADLGKDSKSGELFPGEPVTMEAL